MRRRRCSSIWFAVGSGGGGGGEEGAVGSRVRREQQGETMIDHTGVAVSRRRRKQGVLAAALAPLGYALFMEFEDAAGFGVAPKPDFWIGEGIRTSAGPRGVSRGDARAGRRVLQARRWPLAAGTMARRGYARTITRTITAHSCSIRTDTTSKRCVMRRREETHGMRKFARFMMLNPRLAGRQPLFAAAARPRAGLARQADQVRRRRGPGSSLDRSRV